MARKPTRFWHPARRILLELREQVRERKSKRESTAKLDDMRPRLQHYLRAMYGDGIAIEALPDTKAPGLTQRVLSRVALAREGQASESDAWCVRLPSTLIKQDANVSPVDQYRLVAVQHAERMRRNSEAHGRMLRSDLERDLFQLAEAVTIDAQIADSQPGLNDALTAARSAAMQNRPKGRFRTTIEICVESMIRNSWPTNDARGAVESELPVIPRAGGAESNATWARRTAVALESKYGRKVAQSYRRVPEIALWQTTIRTVAPQDRELALETENRQARAEMPPQEWNAPSRSAIPGNAQSRSSEGDSGSTPDKSATGDPSSELKSGGSADGDSDETEDEDDQQIEQKDRPKSKSKSRKNSSSKKNNKSNQQSDDSNGAPDSAQSAGGANSAIVAQHTDQTVEDSQLIEGVTFPYPEWDFNTLNFNKAGTIVRVMPPQHSDGYWARTALQDHAREISLAKRQFERLRSNRARLRRQVQGDELDIEACVEAMVDRRMRAVPSDRLYSLVRPGRRDLAITLLIDVSGSTGGVVSGEQRVIDIERIAALVASAAFDALGDDYSILAFSSSGASNVRVHTVKDFGEKNASLMQRVSALEPHGTTRLGAAVRHATAMLNDHPAPHRLLLILSDGKPHDYDWYFVDYAIQDSRQAILNARQQGIHPFCITVDATEGETYLTDIFGSAGYRVVSKPSQLSQALLQAVQRLIGT